MNPYFTQQPEVSVVASFPVHVDASDPITDSMWSSLFPNSFPSVLRGHCKQPLATVAISKTVCARRLPPYLAGSFDSMSFSAEVQAPAREPIQLPVVSLHPSPTPGHQASQPGPTRSREKHRTSPYPRGKDKSQHISSRPSDVGHTAQTTQTESMAPAPSESGPSKRGKGTKSKGNVPPKVKKPNPHSGKVMLYVGPHEGRAHPNARLDEAGYPLASTYIHQVPRNQNQAINFVRGFVEMGRD